MVEINRKQKIMQLHVALNTEVDIIKNKKNESNVIDLLNVCSWKQ